METKTCPFCGGTMVKGKSPQEGYALYFWKAPWKKGFKGAISGTVKAYPWLCLNCGAIIPYVEEAELQKVKEEYEEAKLEGRL
ncbi:hypothetical protein OCC_11969 [Thermococcus litoralis DSM 5473]|uniref:Uncharacterized protein n=1 Tax=Thermococcus litoralis (strain ATCC 51850 / DSM 5473 / JCM 8560 / NS-C) TaxID=523849 RepID=H3ZP09_THELN|nr:PF20097 family protein [Thermococcus litoralis]EHR78350.1 hypothetical protein OCC_11969 [Thermococcus litoralis DSM 5473]